MKNKKELNNKIEYFVDKDKVTGISDIGKVKKINEDKLLNLDLDYGYLCAIFDGMGSSESGDIASEVSVDAVTREFQMFGKRKVDYSLQRAFQEANRLITLRKYKDSNASIATTGVAVLIQDRDICIANVGNSRAYLIREKSIQKLTKDHTYIQELLDIGKITKEEAIKNAENNILTRALGAEAAIDIDVSRFWIWDSKDCDVNSDDLILLCSDGLYKNISEKEIIKIIFNKPLEEACKELVKLSNDRGGKDNISVTLMPVIGQIKSAPPFGYKEDLGFGAENIEDEDDDINKEEKFENNYYKIYLIVLTILTNLISLMLCVLKSTLGA